MKFFPSSALVQLEFDKVKLLLSAYCRSTLSKIKVEKVSAQINIEAIQTQLQQTSEFKQLLQNGQYFPNDFLDDISRELRLLAIPGASLTGIQLVQIRDLAVNAGEIFRWFDKEKRELIPALAKVIGGMHYEKQIASLINDTVNEDGHVRDSASIQLNEIRAKLAKKRSDLRKIFDKVMSRLQKLGYMAETQEAFLNGRRVVAVHAEQKRMVRGILHGESDSRRTSFIEPDETIEFNNEVFGLENDERHEVQRILRQLTAKLSVHSALLTSYYEIGGEFEFIRAKSKFAIDLKGNYPVVSDSPGVHLIEASHPLLLLYNQRNNKMTVPINVELSERNRILVISGPNAGGKTVTLKTVGLLQLMVQSGLLVPVHPDSEIGIFSQLMIHIGDTQSIEFELSTYSSHLMNMKYLMENADARTIFFIDELGSGSDPSLGGAFAEAILEELVKKKAFGIVTTHYLNLKIMANKTPGILNGAMAFDEERLQPLYMLAVGKPGSSYTFSIAERIGLDPKVIERAKNLIDAGHFLLDKLLSQTEQDLRTVREKEAGLKTLLAENETLKLEMQSILHKEKHEQRVELLKQQNRITEERIAYLKEMERKLKQIIFDWRKTENKNEVIKHMQSLLFGQREKQPGEKAKKKLESKYILLGIDAKPGDKVMIKKNHQVGVVKEIRKKKVVIQIGLMPITVDLKEVQVVREKT